jgi:hypothetical protein
LWWVYYYGKTRESVLWREVEKIYIGWNPIEQWRVRWNRRFPQGARIVQRDGGEESPFQADLNASAIALVRLTVQMSISSGIVHFPSPLSW